MAAVLLTRGPDAELTKGSTIEMVLDRPLTFAADEVNFTNTAPGHFADGPGPQPNRNQNSGCACDAASYLSAATTANRVTGEIADPTPAPR